MATLASRAKYETVSDLDQNLDATRLYYPSLHKQIDNHRSMMRRSQSVFCTSISRLQQKKFSSSRSLTVATRSVARASHSH